VAVGDQVVKRTFQDNTAELVGMAIEVAVMRDVKKAGSRVGA
jgi:hypothetical protein